MTPPTITVTIPAFDAGAALLASVASALGQTWGGGPWPGLEVVVVDDGSTDGSADLLADRFAADVADGRLRVLRQANGGKSTALNRAMESSGGELIAFQDADDLSLPGRLEAQARLLASRPHLAGCFCGHELILKGRRAAPLAAEKDERRCRGDVMNYRMPAHDPTLTVRRASVEGMAFDPRWRVCQGLDFVMRLGERAPLRVLGECRYAYRVGFAGATRGDAVRRLDFQARVLREAAERRGLTEDEAAAKFPRPGEPGGPAATGRGLSRHQLENGLPTSFVRSVRALRDAGRPMAALANALRCARLHPIDPDYHKPLVHALLPRPLLTRWRPVVG